jgi:hypothetical protein
MAFGLASGLSFAYIPIVKLNGLPLIAYRMPPKSIIKGVQKRLGFNMAFQKFSDAAKGMDTLDKHVEQGTLVGLQTSVYWLPYFPDDMRFHFNAHNLLVYGKDNEEYLVSDPVFEDVVRCDKPSLQKARFAKGALAPKGLMYYPTHIPKSLPVEREIPGAIRKNAKIMYAPLPMIGLKGIRYLSGKIRKLDKQLKTERKVKLYLGHIVRMQEEIGTGGAGFRFIYASFLQEAADRLNNAQLKESSEMMTEAGDQWRQFALNAVKMCKKRAILDLDSLADDLRLCADKEQAVWRVLRKFKG